MAYSTKADLVAAYTADIVLELTDDVQAGTGDDDIVAAAIAFADAEIDARLGQRYDVPFTTVPTIVELISIWLAAGFLNNRRRRANASIAADAQRARQWLADPASGEMVLDDATVSDYPRAWSTTEDEQPVFTRARTDANGAAVGPFDETMIW